MEHNELKRKLEGLDIPPPSEMAKKQALEAARTAYVAHQEKSQGSARSKRPTFSPTEAWEQLIGRFSMKRAYVFAGSFAALATVLAITTSHYSTIMSPVITDFPQPVATVPPQEKPIEEHPVAQPKPEEKKPQANGGKAVDMIAAPSLADKDAERDDGKAKPKEQQEYNNKDVMASIAQAPAAPPAKLKEVAKKDNEPEPTHANQPQAAAPSLAKQEFASGASVNREVAAHYEERAKRSLSADEKVARAGGRLSNNIMYAPEPTPPAVYEGNDKFESFTENPVKVAKDEPVSTFSLDVDTSSYSFVRRTLNGGQLPPKDAVRIEEMVNYFDYNYSVPDSKENPFKPTVTVYPNPWNKDTKLVHIGIKGYDMSKAEKPRSNLVFLIDVSGSMNAPDRLPLVKSSLRMLLDQLQPDDTVGIVVYAGNVGTVLEPTRISQKSRIVDAIEHLSAGGSTAGGEGIRRAYDLARSHFDKNAVNRVILSTDGDFNVGITDPTQLQSYIEQQRDSGIFLSILGVGQGNYNDALMQKLAQNGNGTAAYVDNLNEARKLLVEEANATLFTIAKDVKVQVEFNPDTVAEYRLVGYESRLLKREDFNNDKIDAGDVGSGHAVTAIYEITPVGATPQVDGLRYGKEEPKAEKKSGAHGSEYAFLKIRYKLPDATESKLLTTPIDHSQEVSDIKKASDDVRFSTAVAGFGQLLKGDTHLKSFSYDDVLSLADGARGKDPFGYRVEFTNMVRLAKTESGQQQPVPVDTLRYEE